MQYRNLRISAFTLLMLIHSSLFSQDSSCDSALSQKLSEQYKQANQSQNYSEAIGYLTQLVTIEEKCLGKDDMELSNSYNSMGMLYYTIGNYPKSLEYYKKNLAITEKVLGKENIATASSYNNLGLLYEGMGDYVKALDYYKQALAIKEKTLGKDDDSIATSYNNIGVLYKAKKDYPQALTYFNQALEIREKVLGKDHINTAVTYNNIGLLYFEMKDYPKALDYYKKALEVREKVLGKEHTATATAYNNIASLYYRMEDYPQALEYYTKAMEVREKVLGKEHTDTATTYSNVGMLNYTMQNYAEAYRYVKMAYDVFMTNRDRNFALLNSRQKQSYLKANSQKAPFLLKTAYMYGVSAPDQQVALYQTTMNDWLNYKGSIYDSENAIATLYEQTTDPDVKAEIEHIASLKRDLAKLYQTITDSAQYQQKVKETEQQINEAEHFISTKAASFQEEVGLRTISYKDIAKHLKPHELYIDYAKAGEYYYVFALDGEEKIAFSQISRQDTEAIDNAIKAFREDIETVIQDRSLGAEKMAALKKKSQESLGRIYDLAFSKPLAKVMTGQTELIISADGALRLIPFEALYDTKSSKYLIEEKNIRYIPSGKEMVRLLRYNAISNKNDVVVFSNPDFDYNKVIPSQSGGAIRTASIFRASDTKSLFKMRFSSLPATAEEAQNVKNNIGTIKTDEYVGQEASEVNLLKVNQPKILHIATHGFFINDPSLPNPMLRSGIALSGANVSAIMGKSDGIVTSLKLSGLNLKGTDLVVLSACQTGAVDPDSTESVSGLNKAFIQAGAKNIVMSLWSVADHETMELMSSFYHEMQHERDFAQALRTSKLKMIKEGLHPYYWAPFVISGVNI